MAGLLIGPVVASLFLTIWELCGVAFQDMLPAVGTYVGLATTGSEGKGQAPGDGAAASTLFDADGSWGTTAQCCFPAPMVRQGADLNAYAPPLAEQIGAYLGAISAQALGFPPPGTYSH